MAARYLLITAWFAVACGGSTAPGNGGGSGGVGGSGGGGSGGGGPFAHCETPPPSTCSVRDTCASIDCGGPEFDEDGCKRTVCEDDVQCTATERCVAIECAFTGSCAPSASGCNCEGPLICLYGGACNPVSVAGPRGAWQTVELLQGSGPCPPGQNCTWRWTVTPDGRRQYDEAGVTGSDTLDALALGDLDRLIDGPDFRPGMDRGFTCDPPPTDIGVTLRLVLPGRTLEQDVTGCVMTGPEGNVAARVAGYVRR